MYFTTKRSNNSTRAIGAAAVVLINAGVAVAVANGFGQNFFKPPVESEVVIIEVPEVEEDEPPPPPPVDVDLPPPPPQVILPDFIFDQPPPPNAIQQVQQVKEPVRTEVKPAPPPRPVLPPVRPVADKDRFSKMMTEDYPARALRAKQEGDVTVSMCVNTEGRASDVKLIGSSGIDSLDDATVKGIAKLRFTPAKDGSGKPVAWCPPTYPAYQLTVSWKLPKD